MYHFQIQPNQNLSNTWEDCVISTTQTNQLKLFYSKWKNRKNKFENSDLVSLTWFLQRMHTKIKATNQIKCESDQNTKRKKKKKAIERERISGEK
jgi:hypothetical protein